MDEGFQTIDLQAAQEFLRGFPPDSQKRGQDRFRDGAVESLDVDNPGASYSAIVQDRAWKNEVTLRYDATNGWAGLCSCPRQLACAHIFAAMSALIAEHRMAVVRELSRGQATTPAALAGLRAKPDPANPETLTERFQAVTGQPVPREAQRFLKQIHELYKRCSQSRHLGYWELRDFGLPILHHDWNSLKIWPAFPRTEHEFWLYLANFMQEQKVEIPAFMAPITDLSLISDSIARWRRAQEIEKWNQALGNLRPPQAKQTVQEEMDLRLVLGGNQARLEWKRPSQPNFEPLKQQQFRQLLIQRDNGELNLLPDAELLWETFTSFADYGPKVELDSDDLDSASLLNRLLRIRSLNTRVVGENGLPLERAAEPLRWEVLHAQDEKEDYRLRLVQADGSAPPPILCILPGNPTFYLTDTALFTGPNAMDHLLDPTIENRIPAPALERSNGVSFLQSLGVELPPRVRERVRTLAYQVTIQCALKPEYPGSDLELCFVKAFAEAPDGNKQIWTGNSWAAKSLKKSKKPKNDDSITVYETGQLDQVPALLEPLNLRSDYYDQGRLSTRLTRKFADNFSAWLKTIPAHIHVELEGELASLAAGEVAGSVKLEVTEKEIDWFDLQVVLNVADTTLSPEEVKLLLNAKGSFVRLKDKGWRRLQFDLTEDENERLARLGLSPRELSAEPQRLHALQLADEAARKFLPEEQVVQIQRRASELKARVAPDLPAGITAQLRPYQLEGFHFLAYLAANRFGGILADDMGLGKTLQTLAWLVWLRQQTSETTGQPLQSTDPASALSAPPALVVCPKSVMDNWRAEASRFAPGLRVKTWPAASLDQFLGQITTADVHVLNYNQLRVLGESLASVDWLAVILDEGQYIKNPSSQTAQIARSLKARHRLVLSGTPIENRLLDLWSLMAFTMPGILSSRAQFARLYDAKGDPLARRRLAARVRPFLLRRTKAQVAKDLPDRIEEDLLCEIEGEQKDLYRAELKAAQQLLLKVKTQKELAQQQFHFLTSLLRLRQICCHPRLVQPTSAAIGAKTEALLELLEPLMEEGQKVLVFSQFVQMLDLLRPALVQRQWPVFYLAGQTENRGELVQKFQESTGASVFLISLKAGGFGLNLTAASYVVLFDPWWNPAVENQAIDRTHRIGQTNNVIAYRLLIKDSIEEKIRELQRVKKAMVQDVLGEEKFAQSLTLDDLRFLLAD